MATFTAALKRLTDAGVELVKFDMGLLSAEGAEVEAELLLAYEAPREIARYILQLCALVDYSMPATVTYSMHMPYVEDVLLSLSTVCVQ